MAKLAKAHPDDTEATIFYALALAQTALPTDKSYTNLLAGRRPARAALRRRSPIIPASRTTSSTPTTCRRSRRRRSPPRGATRKSPRRRRTRFTCRRTRSRASAPGRSRSTPTSRRPKPRTREHAVSEEMHAMDYLVYAYLQTGAGQRGARRRRDRACRSARAAAEGRAPASRRGTAADTSRLAAIPARYALERSAWAEAAALDRSAEQHTPRSGDDAFRAGARRRAYGLGGGAREAQWRRSENSTPRW